MMHDMEKLMKLIERVGEALEDLGEMGAKAAAILVNPYTLDYMLKTGLVEGKMMLYGLPVYSSMTVQPETFRLRTSFDVTPGDELAAA
jgi:hypothetical protein